MSWLTSRQALFWRRTGASCPTTRSPASARERTRDANRPAPTWRARAHAPTFDAGLVTLGCRQIASEGLEYLDPKRCVVCRCCTSRRSNTHSIATREILYRWHPWYGRSVRIYQVVDRNGQVWMRCGDDQVEGLRRLEVPQWMFESAACGALRMAGTPVVDCEALLDLKALLASAVLERRSAVEQAEHLSLPCTEGANAQVTEAAAARSAGSTEALSSTVCQAALGAAAAGDPAANGATAGKAAARAPRPRREPWSDGGGR